MTRLGPACALILVAVVAAAAQEKPDFSGRWILATPRDEGFARELTVRYEIEEGIRAITVERQFATDVQRDTYRLGVQGGMIGGSFPGVTTLETHFSVAWDYDRLIIRTSRDIGATRESLVHTEHNETWWLDTANQLIILSTDRAPDNSPVTTVLTYRSR